MANKNITAPVFGLLTLIFTFVAIANWILQARLAFWICLLLALVSLVIFARLRFSEVIDFVTQPSSALRRERRAKYRRRYWHCSFRKRYCHPAF